MNGIIVGSCFSQETPSTEVFPADAEIHFLNCNLDNCVIPEGCTVDGGSVRRHKHQNDGRIWEIDDNGIPTNIIDCYHFWKHGLRMPNPAEIPDNKVIGRPTRYEVQ